MNRVINYFSSIHALLSTIGSAEQRAEAAQLAACPVTESVPVELWLDHDSLLETVVNAQKRLTTLLRRKGLVGETRAAIAAATSWRMSSRGTPVFARYTACAPLIASG